MRRIPPVGGLWKKRRPFCFRSYSPFVLKVKPDGRACAQIWLFRRASPHSVSRGPARAQVERGQDVTDDEQAARAAIAATLGACTQAGDARKADAYAETFAEDGVLELDRRIEGREAIRQWMKAPSVIPQPSDRPAGFVSHHLTTCRIEVTSPTTATVRTYWFVITPVGLDHSGYYDDRFCKEGDAWLIAHRKPRTLWVSPDSLLKKA
jgi:hypothetical protein